MVGLNMITFGCVNSNINPYSIALKNIGFECLWLVESDAKNLAISKKHNEDTLHVNDIEKITSMILCEEVKIPNVIFGKNPISLFHNRRSKKEIDKFLEFKKIIDVKCEADRQKKPVIVWEDMEGILQSGSNLFGEFIGLMAGNGHEYKPYDCCSNSLKWQKSGHVIGNERKIAWRVLNSKMFGIPNQRKRLYVVSTDLKHSAVDILGSIENMKDGSGNLYDVYANRELCFLKNNKNFKIFREYVDGLNGSYGTAWNSISVLESSSMLLGEDGKLRRYTPLECERLMGLPDDYTKMDEWGDVVRYKVIANASVVNVIRWIGYRIIYSNFTKYLWNIDARSMRVGEKIEIEQIVDSDCDVKYFVSDIAKLGMLKRIDIQKSKMSASLIGFLKK
jgi:DNA (cytosine-5)-methyltransferase 1